MDGVVVVWWGGMHLLGTVVLVDSCVSWSGACRKAIPDKAEALLGKRERNGCWVGAGSVTLDQILHRKGKHPQTYV